MRSTCSYHAVIKNGNVILSIWSLEMAMKEDVTIYVGKKRLLYWDCTVHCNYDFLDCNGVK